MPEDMIRCDIDGEEHYPVYEITPMPADCPEHQKCRYPDTISRALYERYLAAEKEWNEVQKEIKDRPRDMPGINP